jgi:hypothetical protein
MGKPKRKRAKAVILSAIAIIIVCIVAVVLTGMSVSRPTTGAIIPQYDSPKSALLVIDMQNDITDNAERCDDTELFVNNVNEAIATAEASNMEVLYVRNVWDNPIVSLLGGGFKDGTTGRNLRTALT